MDIDSKPFELRTLQRTATDAIQEASRAERGADGRLFWRPAAGKRPSVAPASQLGGSGAMSMLARAALPARFAFPEHLSHAAESAPDCSLHRRVSVANDAVYSAETAQTSPIITTTEVPAKDAASGGFGGVGRGLIAEYGL